MKRTFSNEQLDAIFTPGNVIVSAGAGSGKTTVMVERIVRKLAQGHKLDRMLIVTFTRASAADIRIKLAERLSELKRGGDDMAETAERMGAPCSTDMRRAAADALEALPVCNIGTLHSFCQRLIKKYYFAAGIDPSAALADEREANGVENDCIRRAVRALRDSGDATARDILDALGNRRDDEGAVGVVGKVLDYALSLFGTREYLNCVPSDTESYAALDEMLKERRAQIVEEIRLLRADIAAVKYDKLGDAAALLEGLLDGKIDAVDKPKYMGHEGVFIELGDRFKAVRDECKAYRADFSDAEVAKGIDSAPFAKVICDAALDALDRYEARKAALGKIDYSDLEHGAMNVLSDPDCMKEIADSLDFVFIDEYQDVNPLQADIAQRLKNGAGAEMFLVGDIKQSIYAFRRCDPTFFRNALADPDYTPIFLNRNYRSSEEVIDFINRVFTGVMRSDYGGADYSADRLICGSGTHGGARFIAVDGKDEQKPDGDSLYSVVRAPKGGERPDAAAKLIVDMIVDYRAECGEKDCGSIAVLVRSARTAFCDGLIRLMRKNGIAVDLGRKTVISDYPEALALLCIARCVDNRFDDIALYTALRSPMGGFSDAELSEIATVGEAAAIANGVPPEAGGAGGRKSYCFRQKVGAYSGRLEKRLCEFMQKRDEFCEYAGSHDAADVLGYITSRTDFFQYVYERGGSASAVEAVIFDAENKKCDLSSYLASTDGDTELTVGDGGDAVTVTTVHGSKGLEYDFVIVADIGRKFNMRDASSRVIAARSGVAVKYPDSATRRLLPTARWLLERAAVPDRLRAEELRLFYVALTRAKRRLVVCGKAPSKLHEPRFAACEYDFMKNILPERAEPSLRRIEHAETPDVADAAVTRAVRKRCESGYSPSDAPIKTCVTAIASQSEDDYTSFAPVLTDDDYMPGAEEYGAETVGAVGARYDGSDLAARRGTAYHRAMELIDFDDPNIDAVRAATDNAELVDFDDIVKAVSAMRELTKDCSAYFKERYFIADMPVNTGGSVLVQGVIDLLILRRDGTAVIVDYKTTSPDRISNGAYAEQLRLYKEAVERSSPFKVSEKYLYSFALGKLIKCG